MEYVEINESSKVACHKNGKHYTYSFIDGSDEFNKVHQKQPIEHSKNTGIGKILFEIICKEPVSAITESERKSYYERKFNKVLQSLQDILEREDIREVEDAKAEAKVLEDSYKSYYEKFKGNCDRLGYTPLQYLVRIFEGYGVNSTLEIFKAYLGFLQTLTGAKGTNVIAIGNQSSGKTHILENPLDCIPDEYVHRGVPTKPAFFTKWAGHDLTHHIFYMGDLGGSNDDDSTIDFRDTMKRLSTDGSASRDYKVEGEPINETITGYPAIVYTTVNEDMVNDQEKSRSIILMPPDVDKALLMIYDSFLEAPASDFELKREIEQSKNLVKGFSWYLMNNFCELEMYNPYMFAVMNYLSNIDDFNRKIKEFNMLLKLVIVLNDGFTLTHDLYYNEREEPIKTKLVIASKKDVVDALNLFEGSSGLLPTEVALIKGLLDNYVCYDDALSLGFDPDDDISFEDFAIRCNKPEDEEDNKRDLRIGDVEKDDNEFDLKFVDEVTDKGIKYYVKNWDKSYKVYDDDIEDYTEKYVWFTVPKIKSLFNNLRWYRNISKKLSEKLLKLHEFGMLIKIGKTESGANIYGINYGVEDLINNIEPNWSSSAIKEGINEFHRKYPTLIDEFDEFIANDRRKNIKYTDMEIRDNGLYDLPWRR